MNIVFSGHRDCVTEYWYMSALLQRFPNAHWIHGGAADGFDSQVEAFARRGGIVPETVRPDYKKYPPKVAPIIRNHQMVDRLGEGDLLVVCWDGRKTGGTWDTFKYARKKKIKIEYAPCNHLEETRA